MDLATFLDILDRNHASYRLDRVRDAVMVIISTPGYRWEAESMGDGTLEVEKFASDGAVSGDRLAELLAALD